MSKLMTAAAAMMITTFSFAQPTPHTHKNHKMRAQEGFQHENPYKQLNLTADQKAKMKTYNEDFHKQMEALKSNEKLTAKEQRERHMELTKSHRANLESLLTDGQKKQLADRKDKQQSKQHEMGGKQLQHMQQQLNLTDEQVSLIKSDREALHKKMEDLRNNTNLSPEQRREQQKALHQEMKSKMDNVLTSEQKAKLKTLKQDRMKHKKEQKD